MFKNLSERLSSIFSKITGHGILNESDINITMREIRRALIEADVSLEVVKKFIITIKKRAIGSAVIKSIKPGQMVVKIVYDELIKILGKKIISLNLNAVAPISILIAGMQGSGKTSTTVKLANYLIKYNRKKVLVASLDVYRPAAQEQLTILAKSINLDVLSIIKDEKPLEIAKRAKITAKSGGYDILIIDTAGRSHTDDKLMNELIFISNIIKPEEILLVVDSLMGQDSINLARSFNHLINITGISLTRIDGDGRGGAALSMCAVTNCPIKFLSIGEKIEDLVIFDPERIAKRILGMSDIVAFVEKAVNTIDSKKAEIITKKLHKGKFDLNDLSNHFKHIEKIGGISSLINLLPGLNKIKNQISSNKINSSTFKYQIAIISSMTKYERVNPKLLNASRKKRIAKGSGCLVQEINKLLKIYRQMIDVMKKMSKNNYGNMFSNIFGNKALNIDSSRKLQKQLGALQNLNNTSN